MTPVVRSLTVLVLLGCGSSAPATTTTAPAPGPSAPVAFGSIDAALAGSHRSAENRARDVYRHPKETLAFFGVAPGQEVIELWPGRGWYTELLAPLLHDSGKLVAVAANNRYLQGYRDLLASRPDLYGNVELRVVEPPNAISLGPDGSADVVLTFRNVHNWVMDGFAEPMHAAVFRVLKPGGVYGVVDHRAPEGSPAATNTASGYVTEAAVIALATGAGLVLEEKSEVNANPRDTHDHPEGVWTLPPALRLGDQDRERYLAIGESDRMTLRFRKPAAP